MTAQLTLATQVESEAAHFLAANPGAEDFIRETAERDLLEHGWTSMDFCCHMLRRSGLLQPAEGHTFALNDHLTSVLSRYFKREYGLPFKTRASKHDGAGAL